MTGKATETVFEELASELANGGEVTLSAWNQTTGMYCSVSGLGVRAGGYGTVEEAVAAWLKALRGE